MRRQVIEIGVTVPAGTFDTRRYEVVEHGTVTLYDSAMDMPGPPVRVQVGQENGPPPETTMALRSFTP